MARTLQHLVDGINDAVGGPDIRLNHVGDRTAFVFDGDGFPLFVDDQNLARQVGQGQARCLQQPNQETKWCSGLILTTDYEKLQVRDLYDTLKTTWTVS